jgi:hypothetical protein
MLRKHIEQTPREVHSCFRNRNRNRNRNAAKAL